MSPGKVLVMVCLACGHEWRPRRGPNLPRARCPNCKSKAVVLDFIDVDKTPKYLPI
jgi:DNA-directed RNA polymerase subunit RPC12/RpoP